MNLNEYQKESRKTAVYKSVEGKFIYPLLGLAGETGEVIEKFKKMLRNDDGVITDEFRLAIKKELGDVLWYISNLAVELKLDLDDIASTNIEKLFSRKERSVISGSGDNR